MTNEAVNRSRPTDSEWEGRPHAHVDRCYRAGFADGLAGAPTTSEADALRAAVARAVGAALEGEAAEPRDLEAYLSRAELAIADARDALADEREGDLTTAIAALGFEAVRALELVTSW